MKKILFPVLIFALSSVFTVAFGQFPGGRGGGREFKPYHERPAIGKLIGKVIDSETNEPLEFATVSVILLQNDSVVSGGLTNKKGEFYIEEIRPARYKVNVDLMGYDRQTIDDVMIFPRDLAPNLGEIALVAGGVSMEGLDITAKQDLMVNDIDKKVYKVEQMINAIGGNINDVLSQLPSLDVDIDGNISLRGSQNVNVLIDGKPSGLTGTDRAALLEQIPASSVERVEVITNPSAKYDPDGMSGILNLVLKKNKRPGINGGVTVSLGTWSKYNTSANINFRNRKMNVYTNYGFRYDDRWSEGKTTKVNNPGDTLFFIDQENEGRRISPSHMVRAGMDYYIDQRNTIGFSAMFNHMDRPSFETIEYREFGSDTVLSNFYTREIENTGLRQSYDLNLDYKHEFKKKNQEFTAGLRYSKGYRDQTGDFSEQYYTLNLTEADSLPFQQRTLSDNGNRIVTAQIDYVHPVLERGKLEIGLKSIIRNIDNDFFSSTFSNEDSLWTPDIFLNNTFEYREQVHAAYGIYGHRIGKFSLQGGMRIEQALTNFDLVTTGDSWKNNYFSFFPSAHVLYEITENHEVKASYSRRINRPSVRSLNPFTNFSDPLNLRFGNPRLQPEYINIGEFGYSFNFKKGSFTTTAYFRDIRNMIQRKVDIDEEGVTTVTWLNFGKATSYGLEAVAQLELLKWWNIMLSGNIFRTKIDGSNVEADLNSDAIGGSLRAITDFRFGKNGPSLQITSNYRAPRVIPQGKVSWFFNLDLALKQTFFDNKLSMSFRISDLTNSRRFRISIDDQFFSQESYRKRESRIAWLSLTYRFGQQNMDFRKKRGGGFNREDVGEDMF